LAGVEAVSLEVDFDLAMHAAPDVDPSDTRNLFEALTDLALENEGQLLKVP
jgi:hypothetical protein